MSLGALLFPFFLSFFPFFLSFFLPFFPFFLSFFPFSFVSLSVSLRRAGRMGAPRMQVHGATGRYCHSCYLRKRKRLLQGGGGRGGEGQRARECPSNGALAPLAPPTSSPWHRGTASFQAQYAGHVILFSSQINK